jgi:hypothetical protein
MDRSIYIISAGRPAAVARMYGHLDEAIGKGSGYIFWVVPDEDRAAYEAAGANVVPGFIPRHLTRQRNIALEHAFAMGRACTMLDDDFKRVRAKVEGGARNEARDIDLYAVMRVHDAALDATGLYLVGNSPTDNVGFARDGVSTRKFVPCPCITVRPSTPRFDENLRLKEDYDFTLQHWMTYGGAARCDFIAPSFGRYTNEGGAVSYRTAELEQETIAYLMEKWPGMLRLNPRRANEILLPTPRRHR